MGFYHNHFAYATFVEPAGAMLATAAVGDTTAILSRGLEGHSTGFPDLRTLDISQTSLAAAQRTKTQTHQKPNLWAYR